MTYTVLARKWRPRRLEDMVGQEPILRMLTNALQQKRIHHAYLFTGTRGVGKTTLGRILAKCLNCESGITANPCDSCQACKAIDAGQFLDLYEVDAASRTKVEDTRDLLENVLYAPSQGRYKIYLIDEVHMLSNHSFNALLKTLEEPPEHVKFILATTDPKRLPITILSRCLQFHLKRMTPEQITQHLQHICNSEHIPYEIAALQNLAKAADGSMRDALSLLDQAIAYGNQRVNLCDIQAMLASIAQDDVIPLLEALAQQNCRQLFRHIEELSDRAPDFKQVLEECIGLFHQLALYQIVPEQRPVNDQLISLAKQFTPEEIQLYYQIALLGRRDLAFTPHQQQGFEMIMLRMLAFKPSHVIATIPDQHNTIPNIPEAKTLTPAAPVQKPSPPLPAPSELSHEWRELLPKLSLSGMAQALASNCTLKKKEGNKIELALSVNHQPMLNQKLKERIAEALILHFKQAIQLEIHVTADEIYTPHKQHEKDQTDRLNQAKKSILQDAKVKQLIEIYDATVEVSLLS